MQIVGFSVRLSSGFLWIQMYRLGASYIDSGASREADYDLRNSFLNPATPAVVTQNSDTDQVLGGSIYDPAYYSSLFSQDNGYSYGVCIISSFIYKKYSFYKLNIPFKFFWVVFMSNFSTSA